ncbi:MAG: ABC transporter substrate-binding protein [Candidatus Rokubacteria bacterium]|nr:ABC transporter substrate-binding protein [Candidatus Rokubacteria bacterium]
MTIFIRHRALVLGALFALVAAPAWAGPATEQLKGSIEKIIPILEDPALTAGAKAQERRSAVRAVTNEIFDFAESARRTLGRHWDSRTEQERREFTQLFGDLLGRAFISKLDREGGVRITFTGESADGDLGTVKTRITTKNGSELPVDYQVLRRGDHWRVYDVLIEGVSLMQNYRAQFNKIIRTSSYEELVQKLKAKQQSP